MNNNLSKREIIFLIVISILLLSNIYFYVNFKNTLGNKVEIENLENNTMQNQQTTTQLETEKSKTFFVYVCGKVKTPGVYEMADGDRIIDAINKAGGVLNNADLSTLNLAEKVKDEMKIYVPDKNENHENSVNINTSQSVKDNIVSSNLSKSTQSNKININNASKAELETLPYIGEVLADRIIEYRQKNGRFKSLEEIKNVEGIGEKRYEAIKDLITCD